MKRLLYILILSVSLGKAGLAQQLLPLAEKNYTDSLERVLRSGTPDSPAHGYAGCTTRSAAYQA